MKVWRYIVFSFIASCVIFGGGICYRVGADEGLPAGLKILKEKMEKKEIPDVDFAKFKIIIPDTMPDEINNLKGYLWSGRSTHSAHIAYREGSVGYLFLIDYNKETGEMTVFYAWEAGAKIKPGRAVLRGNVGTEDKGRIELKSEGGSPFILLMKNKDHLTLRSHSGYEADMKKIGTISPPPK
jgi:hypothetical protein